MLTVIFLLLKYFWYDASVKMITLLHQDVVESFQITDSIIPTRAASKQPSSAGTAPARTSSSTQVNGAASSSGRTRASYTVAEIHTTSRSSAAGPSSTH